ncbi:hypothetical protein NGA_0713700 [Nannochloropsis gaditana CCMP526]|uniref:uncharacterized protein n=1 Tax=Nannochloropsis gaditana (strain CCMP526) TaxID=1093141 RepID=UPI00029F7EF0|nr:hypothetical protein NGA_0713700 [Nannochloropsis gaditana CCMP526]EKU23212.1 hypothetical protein NGA_0713700 [Nannochloropsis gaditana CCMP526]|eukprot:XP_005852622.1 hypothetical protein NGA_0713700 [Nannochloropsis gaditana CCMP526]
MHIVQATLLGQDIFEKRCHRNLCHISSRSIASTGHIGSGSTNAQGPQLFAFDEAMAMREVSPSSPLSSHLPSRPRVFQGYLDERWSYGDAPNGGILTSMAITAARRLSSPARPDPLSVSTYFVKKVRRGRVLGRGDEHRGDGQRELSTPFLPRLLAHSRARPSRCPQALEKTPVFLHVTPLAASRSQETLQVGVGGLSGPTVLPMANMAGMGRLRRAWRVSAGPGDAGHA